MIGARLRLGGGSIRKIDKDLDILPHRMLSEICGYVKVTSAVTTTINRRRDGRRFFEFSKPASISSMSFSDPDMLFIFSKDTVGPNSCSRWKCTLVYISED